MPRLCAHCRRQPVPKGRNFFCSVTRQRAYETKAARGLCRWLDEVVERKGRVG